MTSGTIIVGADPGLTGAVAFLDPATMSLRVHDTPMGVSASGKGVINLIELAELTVPPDAVRYVAVIEDVHAMTKPGQKAQGVVSTFNFGRRLGNLEMAFAGHGYEMRTVPPSTWKRHFKLTFPKGTKDSVIKAASRTLATQRFPANAKDFLRVKDHGRAEAALIALYGAEVFLRAQPNAA